MLGSASAASRVTRIVRSAGRIAGIRAVTAGTVLAQRAVAADRGVAAAALGVRAMSAAADAATSPVTLEKTSDGIAIITINDPKERVSVRSVGFDRMPTGVLLADERAERRGDGRL
jgi:hypothetical protein